MAFLAGIVSIFCVIRGLCLGLGVGINTGCKIFVY